MKKYLAILISVIAYFSHTAEVSAQGPEAYAGGEITARYVGDGSEACGDPLPYEFTLRLFRDDPGGFAASPLPLTREIAVYSLDSEGKLDQKATGGNIVLDNFTYVSTVPTPCLVAPTAVTDGGIYTNSTPVMLDGDNEYVMVFGNEIMLAVPTFLFGLEFNSPNNNNLESGRTFTLSSRMSTRCVTTTTSSSDNPPGETVSINYGKNSMPQWITNGNIEIVLSLCDEKPYVYNLYNFMQDVDQSAINVFDENGFFISSSIVADSLAVKPISVRTGYPGSAFYPYVLGRSGSDPFPTKFEDPYTYDEATGELSFTSELPNGQTFYTAALTIRTTEYRQGFKLVPKAGGGFDRVPNMVNIGYTDRQVRFIIGDESRCNDNLPSFSSERRNAADDAWEFDCASNEFTFTMDVGMLAHTVSQEAPFDMAMFRGTDPYASAGQDAIAIKSINIDPANINSLGEFTEFTVVTEERLGPGKYVMYSKKGNDNNTWGNLCGFFRPEFIDSIPIEINTNYEYIFKDDDDALTVGSQKDFCYPGDEGAFMLDALFGQDDDFINKADSVVAKFRGQFSPTAPAQRTEILSGPTFNNGAYNVYPTVTVPPNYSFPTVPLITPTRGWWTVGVGLRFTYPFEGDIIVTRCYDEDVTEVNFFEHPKVNTADIDLCIDEDFPVIKDLVDPQFKVYDPISTFSPVNYTWGHRIPINGNLNETVTPYVPIGGQSDPNAVLQQGAIPKDSLVLNNAAAIGIGQVNQIKSVVTFPNGCQAENFITVIKQRVEVEIPEVPLNSGGKVRDTAICEGSEFRLSNSKGSGYYRQDYMSRQWYFNDEEIEGATTDILPAYEIAERGKGWYKLIVTKTTENSVCEGSDSAFINIADQLDTIKPECTIVTFQDGDVRQRFFWPAVEGADDYQVRPVDQNGDPLDNDGNPIAEIEWYEANDEWGIHHWVGGKEVRLYVRGVNNEVPEEASCKYGVAGLAEACEIIVKPVNIFTPNGDGINDFLRFDLLEVFEGSKLTVFNRWGRKVFESSNYQNDWDGGNLKEGTYFYILDIDDPSGTQDIFKGNFTIVR